MQMSRRSITAGLGALALPRPALATTVSYPPLVQVPSGQYYNTYIAAKPWAFSRPASNVMRFEIRTGDQGWSGDPIGVRHRDEVSATLHYPFNTVVWQSWSQLIEYGRPTMSGMVICNQWHNADATIARSPCVQFNYMNEQMAILTDSQASIDNTGNPISYQYYHGPMPRRGVWHSFVCRYEFGDANHGSLRVWMDGAIITDLPLKPIGCWSDVQGPYNKFGVYCADGAVMPPVFAINYANMQVGYNDMMPLIQRPLATPKWTWGYQTP